MLITLKDIKKILGGDLLFENLNFEIQPGEKIGLVGRNGSGKTTIFKLINQIETPDDGQVFIKKQANVGYLSQIPEGVAGTVHDYLKSGFSSLMTIQEKMKRLETDMQDENKMERAIEEYGKLQDEFMRLGGYEIESQIEKVAHGLHLEGLLFSPFQNLSGGEKTKAGLARILLEQPDVLLLDEPTNHLDLHAIEWLESYIQQYDGAVCIISHDRQFLDQTVEKIYDLDQGEINVYIGNFTSYVKEKEERLLAEFKAYQEQQKKIKKMKEAIKRLKIWANQANPPSEKLHKRARNMERALERMEKLDKPNLDPQKMGLSFDAEDRTGKDVIVAENVTKSYGDTPVLQGLELHLRYQERLAIVGRNGSGKSTFLKLIIGSEQPDGGEISLGAQVSIGYLPQEPLKHEDPDMQMIEYFREHVRVTEGQARQILARFMFFGYAVFQRIGMLSGGEQMRLKLAVFMHQNINLLILDEPTNHLDIDSQEVLEEAIENFNGTVLGVSHDRYFLNSCFTETAFLHEGVLHRYPRRYEEARLKWQDQLDAMKTKEEHVMKSKKPVSNISQSNKGNVHLEKEIEEKEQQLQKIEEEMEKADTTEELIELQQAKEKAEAELESYYDAWIAEKDE
ncbi:ribosomal protection-like ABC-F family protein [Pontibacillus marinus]|uniref:ABC transporter ATP-binding protein n=1 Tax=Pontibacillus marinus BH030004 = DSM 16465 TaxID=1385511 RepID=A0A0A5G3Z6_9BACI|nr:ABC-F family ATP-binding cassette domain-containing protein [Pontibacillus marinus]KGX87846.1 ABC transporter ATP-binding protein [Pontibacillus marinus BH030004 = DSM 16465]